jgi:hypothetical protein
VIEAVGEPVGMIEGEAVADGVVPGSGVPQAEERMTSITDRSTRIFIR